MSREREFLQQVLPNNPSAVAFCETVFEISQVLDDLIDGDAQLDQGTVIRAFWRALIDLPDNPFYRQHEPFLRPQLATALQDWTDSVTLERSGDEHDRHLAFVLRDQLSGVVVQCVRLVGGYELMRQVGPTVRRFFHDELLSDYVAGFERPVDGDDDQAPAPETDHVYPEDVSESLQEDKA
ncbi:hypothetical protein [Halomonas elongata]|nr:hypothetical protein [Halomonas elongata]WBF19795.1 hypothetical protein LM502_08950 [Halomonas elongata]WPU48664.1 hypothetical protein SR933_07175 [Halomonas elongata DSM 2581]